MKLVATPASPFSRKVRIVLAEKRIDYEFIVDSPSAAGTHVPDYNPLGKIPVLVLDDETRVFDSRVIVEYLDQASPVQRLIPKDPANRLHVMRWQALADGCTDAAVAIVVELRRRPAQQSPEWLARQQQKIERSLEEMSSWLDSGPWCSGKAYSLADIAVGSALGCLDFRMLELVAWRDRHPNLARHFDGKLMERASFRDTVPYL
jgi:glutathione S-transferase